MAERPWRRGWAGDAHASRRPRPDLWAGWRPNGVGETKPNHFAEMGRTVWENRRNLPYAWRLLSKGVCDGCALGVAGFNDWTISGVHLCTTRLNLLKLNTAGPLDPAVLGDVGALERSSGAELRELGRLPYPMVRRRGDRGFRRVAWDEAIGLVADRIRSLPDRDRFAAYLTSRGLTNEAYYAAQKAVRFLGTNNIDSAARVCHAPSTVALKRAVGAAATTCSYTDVIESDLIVLFGADVANAQPVFMKYLYMAKKRGARVAVVNPYREPGLERYWVPSNVESAVFGTKICDEFFEVHTGGDIAFVDAVLKVLVEQDAVDSDFIRTRTTGFDDLVAALEPWSVGDLAARAGSSEADVRRFATMYASAPSAVLIWSMGLTQHRFGTDNVTAIANLGLARANIGRAGAGLMPIRGHSGVQGGAEMGAYATALPGGVAIDAQSAAELSDAYGFPVGPERGMSAAEMIEAAARGEIDVLWSTGGNFLDVLPDPPSVRAALERTPMRVHVDIVVTSQMLVPAETVVLLPAATRYEQSGGGTETTTERRIVFSPEVPGPRIGEARAEWDIWAALVRAVDPGRADLAAFDSGQAIRGEVARLVPLYAGVDRLAALGDEVQWGGRHLFSDGRFGTPDGKARFVPVVPPELGLGPGQYLLSTRRGKQFNSLVWRDHDPLTGTNRDAVFLSSHDAGVLGVADGDAVVLESSAGEMKCSVHVARIRPGNVQVFWPEGNVLIPRDNWDPVALVPDYTAVVTIRAM